MTVEKDNGRLNSKKNVEGYLKTLYASAELSPCAQFIVSRAYRNDGDCIKNNRQWRDELPYSEPRIHQGLKELVDKGFLRSPKKGLYTLEPKIFLKGEFDEIRLIFREGRILIDYDEKS